MTSAPKTYKYKTYEDYIIARREKRRLRRLDPEYGDELRRKQREYRAKNNKKVNETRRKWSRKNAVRLRAYHKKWRDARAEANGTKRVAKYPEASVAVKTVKPVELKDI